LSESTTTVVGVGILDLRTIFVGLTITNAVCLAVIAVLGWKYRKRIAGPLYWVADMGCMTGSMLLIGLRGTIPDWLSIVVANALFLGGVAARGQGLEAFAGLAGRHGRRYVLLAIFVLAHAYFTFVQPDLAARDVNVAIGYLAFSAMAAHAALGRAPQALRRAMRLTGLVNAGAAVLALSRLVGALATAPTTDDYLHSGPVEAVILLALQAINILVSYSVFMMVNEHLRDEQGLMNSVRLRLYEFAATHSLEETLQKTLDEIEPITGSSVGFYHFLSADQRSLSLQAWSSRTVREFCSANGAGSHYDIDAAGVWVDCVRQRRPIIHNDYASLPHRRGLPQGHAPVVRELVVPIFRQDKIVAIIGVGNKPTDYTDDDVQMAQFLADVAWTIAEQKRAEQELRASEQEFRYLFDQSSVGKSLTLPSGEVRVNDAFASMLGYSKAELAGVPWREITHPEDIEATDRVIEQLLSRERNAVRLIKRYLHKNGSVVWTDVSSAVRFGGDDQPLYFITSILNITEAKRAQHTIEVLARFPAENPAPVLRIAKDGTLRYANAAARPLLDEWNVEAGLTVGPQLLERVARALDIKAVEKFQQRAGDRLFEITVAPIEPEGEQPYVNLYGIDVTARHLAETALRNEKAHAESLFQTAQAIILVIDPSGKIASFNPYMEQLTGWTLEETKGRDWFDTFLPERSRDSVRELFSVAVSGASTRGNVDTIVTRDGRERLIEWYDKALTDERGEVAGLLCLGHDVTERTRALEALRRSEESFRLVTETISDVFWMSTPGLRKMVYVSPAYESLWGQSRESLYANPHTFLDKVHPDDLGLLKDTVAEYHSKGRPYSVEYRIEGPDNSLRWIHERGYPIRDDAGRVYLMTGVCADITERRSAEAERVQLQAQIAQSDRLASMGMLAAGVAHEINNPLSFVLYNLDSLGEELPKLADLMKKCHAELESKVGPLGVAEALGDTHRIFNPVAFEDAAARLRDALSGALRIKNISRSLGTFSRVERTSVAPVDVATCIEHAITMSFNEIKYRARLVKDYVTVPAVLASDGKLAQVFLNLLINAAHSIAEGHADRNEIRVRTWSEGDAVCAEVSDTGKGIAPEHQSRIFEPFFTTKGPGFGTGLGLSICKNIIKDFGGDIGFASEPGKGTRFVIRLPRLPDNWRSQAAPASTEETVAAVRGRILVVDDEEGVLAMFSRILGHQHDLVLLSSGEEAQALLKMDRQFDVLLLDLMMPRMSGMELHSWLTSEDPAVADRVVFVTGGAFTPGSSEYLAGSKNPRIEKPFDTTGFPRLVSQLVIAARARG
jgi:PAS domain S-box-containing protein